MHKFKFLACFLIVFTFASCFSTPSNNDAQEVRIYLYKNPNTEFTEYESISLSTKSGGVFYSIDQPDQDKLVMMEIGSYSITDGVITINARKYQAIGTITDEKIVIDDKEFIRAK